MKPPPTGSRRFPGAVGYLLLACLGSGCGRPVPVPEEPPPAPVRAVQPWTQRLDEWAEFPGTTQALPGHLARITAAVEGRVQTVLPGGPSGAAAEGARVHAGQVVVQLDDGIARDNLARAEAAQKQATAQKKQADSAVELARIGVQRLRTLQKESTGGAMALTSPVEIHQAEVALHSAESQQSAAIAKEASAAADVQALRKQLSLYTLQAPIAGRLSTVQVVPGQTIAVGTPVADVVNLDEIDVLFLVPPSRIGPIAVGQPAEIVTSGPSPPAPEGQVVYVAVQAEPDTGSFPVKARFPNRELGLRLNAVARIRIRTAPPKERLVVPLTALENDQSPPRVVIVTDLHEGKGEHLGKARLLRARVGVLNRQQQLAEVLALEDPEGGGPVPPVAGTWFVVAGGRGLENGDRLRMDEVPAPATGGTASGGR